MAAQGVDRRTARTVGRARCSRRDRKSTRLNSSHDQISYAVSCLKKKKCHLRCQSPQPPWQVAARWGIPANYDRARVANAGPFFSNDSAPTEIYTLSLHDALPI